MKKAMLKIETWYEVGMSCSKRRMYGIKDEIWNMCCVIDPEQEQDLYNRHISSYADYEGDMKGVIFYYDKNNELNVKLWEMICNKYDIEFNKDIDHKIHLSIF